MCTGICNKITREGRKPFLYYANTYVWGQGEKNNKEKKKKKTPCRDTTYTVGIARVQKVHRELFQTKATFSVTTKDEVPLKVFFINKKKRGGEEKNKRINRRTYRGENAAIFFVDSGV